MRAFLGALGWVVVGSVAAAGFFVTAFFSEYGALRVDSGLAILFMPLLCGILLGAVLVDYELPHVAAAALGMTGLVLGFVGVFLFSPWLAGLPAVLEGLSLLTVRQVGVSSVLLFPLIITGSVIGHALAASFFPPEGVRDELRLLREDTKRWHEELKELERQLPPKGPQ